MSTGSTDRWPTGPTDPVVGLEISARERRPARHRQRALHPGPGRAAPRTRCTPGRCRRRTRTPGSPGCDVDAGLRRARRGQGADRRRRARAQRRRREARRAAVPQRGDVLRARRLLGARRDAGGGPAGRRRGRGRLRAAARRWSRVRDAIAAESFQGHQRTVSRGDADAALERGRVPVQRRARVRRPGALLPGDQRRAGAGRRERPDLRPVQHPAPVGDPGHRRARARACTRTT